MKIANKISLSFFITTMILIISAAAFVYHIEKGNLKTAIFNHLNTALQSRAQHIETFLEHNEQAVKQISKSIVVRRFLSASKEDEDYGRRLNDVEQRAKDTSETLKYTYSFFVLNKDGIIAASNEKADIGRDKSKNPYFLNAKESVFSKDAYVSTHRKIPSLAFSAPIADGETGEFLGVVISRVNLDKLNSITTDRTSLGKTGEIYIVDKNGYMISPSRFLKDTFLKQRVDTENTRKAFEDVKKFGTEKHEYIPLLYTNYRGVMVLGVHDYIHPMQWIVVAEIDEKEALAPLWKIKSLLISIIIIIPILAWLIGIFIGRLISRPIHVLQKGSEVTGSGDLDYKVGTDAKDEIGQLSRAFDKMTGDLKKTVVSRDYVDNIVNSMADILVVVTPDGKIEKVNRAVLDVLGYNKEELIGKDASLLFPEEGGEKILLKGTELEKLIMEGTLKNYEINFKAKDGKKIPVLFSNAVIRGMDHLPGGPTKDCEAYKEKGVHCEKILSIVCVAKDITERRQAEERLQKAYTELRETQAQLIQTEKMDAVGRMASGVAHEVKNPLGIILQGINYFEGEIPPTQKGNYEMLQMMKDSIKRADSIVGALLDFSRMEELHMKPEDINSILENSALLIQHEMKLKNIEVIKDFGKDLPKVLIDKGKMEQVFVNVFSNAIHAMPKGGKLFIRTYRKQFNEIRFRVGRRKAGEDYFLPKEFAVITEIEDTGVGIPEDVSRKIMDPFFTTKKTGEGTGLGLSIVHKIIDMHRGFIDIKSKTGKGTKVAIALKISRGL